MRLEHIKSFISVVNCKSFSIAAKQVYLSQPTISTHIKQLECELNVQLLVRSTKDVILSEAGLLFYPFAVKLLDTENKALLQLHKTKTTINGTVSIAASSVPGYYILPGFFAYARSIYPDISYRIVEGDSARVIQSILHFETDIGIGSIKRSNEKCICQQLIEDQIVLAAPNTEEYRSMNGEFSPQRLQKETYVVREAGSGTKIAAESIEKELGLHNRLLKTSLQAETSEQVKKGVEKGLGVAFISSLAVRDSVEQGKLLKFDFPHINTTRQIYLLYHRERMMTPTITSVINILKQYCRGIS